MENPWFRDKMRLILKENLMNPIIASIGLLVCSNVFMTFAWYAHLKSMNHKPWIIAALVSWGIALFEYLLQVPANRIGHTVLSVGQLKILQEVITLTVFRPLLRFLSERGSEVGLPLGWSSVSWARCFFCVFARNSPVPEAVHSMTFNVMASA